MEAQWGGGGGGGDAAIGIISASIQAGVWFTRLRLSKGVGTTVQ